MFLRLIWQKLAFFYQFLAFKIINSATHAQIATVFASFIVTLSTTSKMLPLKGPYADHILIPQGSTGSSTFFDIKWKPIFFWLQIQNFSLKFFIVLEIWQKMWN